jgi:hypothetical protein
MMWKIEQFEFPFCKARNIVMNYWKSFVENFKVPYTVLSDRMSAILESALLTDLEIFDVETSWEEIRKGQAKRFTDIDEFLKELKS